MSMSRASRFWLILCGFVDFLRRNFRREESAERLFFAIVIRLRADSVPDESNRLLLSSITAVRLTPRRLSKGLIWQDRFRNPKSHINSWLPLSPKEDIALSAELRSMTVPAPTVQVLCGLAACEALAESFMAIFSSLGWKPKYITGYYYEAPDGIQLWYRDDLERQIADAIEKATSGRLKISTHKFSAGSDQLNLAIGRKR